MTNTTHPHWGRVKDAYDSTYVYDMAAANQELVLSHDAMDALHDRLIQGGLAPGLAQFISKVIDKFATKGHEEYFSRFLMPLPWTPTHMGPLIKPEDIRHLTHMLAGDLKHFLIFLWSNYASRLSTLFYTMVQVMRRTPPTSENRLFVDAFLQVYTRSLLLVPGYPFGNGWQHEYLMTLSAECERIRQPLDAAKPRLILRAYTDRLGVLSKSSSLHSRATPMLATELLQIILPQLGLGCEALFPHVIRWIVRCMWRDFGRGFWNDPSAEVVDACMQLVEHIKLLLEILVERIEVTRGKIMNETLDAIFQEDTPNLLIHLSAHKICANGQSGYATAIPAYMNSIFDPIRQIVPEEYLKRRQAEGAMRTITRIAQFGMGL